MRALNIFLTIVFVILLAFVGLFFWGGTLDVQTNVMTAPAADHPDAFASIQSILSANAAPVRWCGDVPASADGVTLVDMTLTLTNNGFLPAEWLDVEIAPANGDIAVYSLSGETADVPARSAGQLNLKLITRADSNTQRTVTVSYYVYGMKRTVEVTG